MKDPFCSSTKESAETQKLFFQNVSKKTTLFRSQTTNGKSQKYNTPPFLDHKSKKYHQGKCEDRISTSTKNCDKKLQQGKTHKQTKASSNQKSEDRFQGPQRHYKSFPWETFIKNEAKQTEEFLGFA